MLGKVKGLRQGWDRGSIGPGGIRAYHSGAFYVILF